MGIFTHPLPLYAVFAGWTVFVALAIHAALRAPWKAMRPSFRQHGLLGGIVALSLLWALCFEAKPDLRLHLLGASLITLMFDRALALLALFATILVVTGYRGGSWANAGLNGILLAALPTFATTFLRTRIEALLPPNLFIYIFANGFFGAAITFSLVGIASVAAHAVLDIETPAYLASQFIPFIFLLAGGEAFLTGFMTAIFVAYVPGWMLTFDDARYLRPR